MFTVIEKDFVQYNKPTTVYSVKEDVNGIWFMIYTWDSWEWVRASKYKPCKDITAL